MLGVTDQEVINLHIDRKGKIIQEICVFERKIDKKKKNIMSTGTNIGTGTA